MFQRRTPESNSKEIFFLVQTENKAQNKQNVQDRGEQAKSCPDD